MQASSTQRYWTSLGVSSFRLVWRQNSTGGARRLRPLAALPAHAGRSASGHAIPGVADSVLHLFPRGGAPVFVRIPVRAEIGLDVVPVAIRVAAGRFEPIPVARPIGVI